jgi:hypothetical protein
VPLQIAGGVRVLDKTGPGLTVTGTFCVLLHPLAVRVNAYVTTIGAVVVLVSVSFGLFVPEVGPTGVIPATVALFQLNVVPAVALVGM